MKTILISALCILLSALPLRAQGMLPPKKGPAQPAAPPSPSYLMVDDTLSKELKVTDGNGKVRPLLSYKSANDVMVIGFFSPRCAQNTAAWPKIRRLYLAYRNWHAAFVGVSISPEENLAELAEAMTKARISFPVVRDEQQKLAGELHVTAVPEILIVDDWGQLRYRGPVDGAEKALINIIGHYEPVPNPEPEIKGCPLP